MPKGGFPGMGGGNMQQLVRQAQKMQQDVEKVQNEIGETDYTVTVGGGMISAVINGKKEFKSIEINKECVDPDDIEMLQDLILSAVNAAVAKADDAMSEAVNKVTGGINLGL
ncbi:MAG: YbaB/EbfC family nucleoid-associated protein [Clostridia bacterium]